MSVNNSCETIVADSSTKELIDEACAFWGLSISTKARKSVRKGGKIVRASTKFVGQRPKGCSTLVFASSSMILLGGLYNSH